MATAGLCLEFYYSYKYAETSDFSSVLFMSLLTLGFPKYFSEYDLTAFFLMHPCHIYYTGLLEVVVWKIPHSVSSVTDAMNWVPPSLSETEGRKDRERKHD